MREILEPYLPEKQRPAGAKDSWTGGKEKRADAAAGGDARPKLVSSR